MGGRTIYGVRLYRVSTDTYLTIKIENPISNINLVQKFLNKQYPQFVCVDLFYTSAEVEQWS